MLIRKILNKKTNQLVKSRYFQQSLLSHKQRYENSQHSIKEAYGKMINLCKPQLPKYISNSILTLIHSGLFMYLPNIYTDINNLMAMNLESQTMEAINQAYLLTGGKWTAIFTLMGILTYQRRVQFLDISNRIGVRMRMVFFNQILTKQYYRKNHQTQALVHHIITDIKTVSDFTGENIFMGLRGLLFILGGASCLVYTAPHLSLIALGIMALINLMFIGRLQRLRELKTTQNSALRAISSFVGQRFQNLRLIKISNTEVFEQLRFFKEADQFYKLSYEVAKASGLNYGTLEAIGLMALFGVAISGSYLISTGVASFSLIASSTYAMYLAMGFRSLMNFNTQLVKIVAVYSNIQDKIGSIHQLPGYMDANLMHDAHLIEGKIKALEQKRVIQQSKGLSVILKNIFFSHEQANKNKNSQWIYKDFNYEIESGSVVALIGPSGTGKSTLFNMITKLIDPQSGNIYFKNISSDNEEVNIQNFNFSEIQKMISYVTQENYLFKGTFGQNLRYGNHGFDCSEQRLIQCLKLTNAFNFVQQKGGINALVEQKGGNLSGGQRQRIILARALVKHPRLLLMDEATAGIDYQSQKLIVQNLKQCRKQMTIMIITHKIEAFRQILTDTLDLGQLIDQE